MKKFMIVSGIGIFLLLSILVRLLAAEDKTGPIITYAENSAVYTEDEPEDTLLKHVSAKDAEDGDVTNTVMVENILPMLDSFTAKITYVAKDSNNNITKKEVIVPYKPKTAGQGNKITSVTDSKANGENTAGKEADTKVLSEGTAANAPEDSQGVETTEAAQRTGVTAGAGNVKGMNPSEVTGNPVTTGSALNQIKISASVKYPSLILKTHEVKLKRGERFDALSYVDKIVDDKDNNNSLFQRIHIIGYFDMDKAGDYVLLYYAIDSDNNESGKEYLWLDVR
ncbi:hypothetical protein Ana3638_03595 [Anaerocolumna sedimenticola]|uniref:Pesticidal crystal protein Cry22Aa Ig-like domain-containing protein n=1 Tax=Anaerocolumna sedimenticola TaxID=2696063 RepID=A0A6P1TI52_9FIRM|nr:hypothetical protein [Anaerocolumna sedimenticola]QHQ59977.1 hypothetical protein Ana3638_03595 [Anaerocolumna sedimenticola]